MLITVINIQLLLILLRKTDRLVGLVELQKHISVEVWCSFNITNDILQSTDSNMKKTN